MRKGSLLASLISILLLLGIVLPSPLIAQPAFSISDLIITPVEVNEGDSITISATVTNTGNEVGTYTVELKISDAVESTKQVTLGAGGGQTVSFVVTKDTAGTYIASLDGLTATFTVGVSEVTASWPMFRHDAGRTACSSEAIPDDLHLLWVSEKASSGTSTPPIVVDGKLFISSSGKSWCLDTSSGQIIWEFPRGNLNCSPAVVDGKVFIGTEDGELLCLDTNSGAVLWSYQLQGRYQGHARLCSPAVIGENIFILGATSHKGGTIHCLHTDSGIPAWATDIAVAQVYDSKGDFDISVGGCGVIARLGSWLCCLDTTGGKVKWTFEPEHGGLSTAVVRNGRVFVGALNDRSIYCLDENNGSTIWEAYLGDFVYSPPAVDPGRVFACAGGWGEDHGRICCLNADTGKEIWGRQVGGVSYSSLAVANNRVLVSSSSPNTLNCLDASNGSHISSYPMTIPYGESPVVARGKVYVADSFVVRCFGPQTNGSASAIETVLLLEFDAYTPERSRTKVEATLKDMRSKPLVGKKICFSGSSGHFSPYCAMTDSSGKVTTYFDSPDVYGTDLTKEVEIMASFPGDTSAGAVSGYCTVIAWSSDFVIGFAILTTVVLVGGTGIFMILRRRSTRIRMKSEYQQQLELWEADGYDVSHLRRKWFK